MIRAWKQAAAAALCLIASGFAVAADELPDATLEFSGGSVAVIGGVRWGTGTLHYQGNNYPFRFSGVSAADLGAKGIWGTGEVYDLWRLEDYLRERRKQIGSRYDYRYSMLPFVFAELIGAGRLREEELRGLSEEKLTHIRSLAAH